MDCRASSKEGSVSRPMCEVGVSERTGRMSERVGGG